MHLTAHDIARRTGGEVVAGAGDTVARSFAFDSRDLEPGACFVALRGARDGHDFVADAFAAGATVAIVQRVPELGGFGVDGAHAIVRVADTHAALQALARSVRDERPDLEVIAITGSSGKTSTKDMLYAALSTTGTAHANPASFNNEVGLPLTLLGIDVTTRHVVTEMGARFAGNIRDLCAIARPTIGVVTNVGLAHAEHLGGPEGVARVKAELVESLPSTGIAVLNADDPWAAWMRQLAACRVVTVGQHAHADVRITDVRVADDLHATCRVGDLDVDVPLRGAHQLHNAALAVVVARHVGIPPADLVRGLAGTRGSRWRMELERSPSGVTVLNDAYNANPASMEAAVRALAHLPVDGRRIAVLGEMLELGAHGREAHRAIGRLVADLHIDLLVGVGEGGGEIANAARGVATVVVADAHAALVAALAHARPGDAVLVKASRAVGLEVVAEKLLTAS